MQSRQQEQQTQEIGAESRRMHRFRRRRMQGEQQTRRRGQEPGPAQAQQQAALAEYQRSLALAQQLGYLNGALLNWDGLGQTYLDLDDLAAAGIQNILALRGDPPQDTPASEITESPYHFASDLVSFVRQGHPEMGIGVAAYPETHPEAISPESDLGYLKLKMDLGGDFAVTQLFFDNQLYFDFVQRARERGISKLIIPGILPVLNLKMIERIKQLSGAYIPPDFMASLEAADQRGGAAEVRKVGVAHARKQAEELLAAGVQGVHLYTFNKAEAILELTEGLLP